MSGASIEDVYLPPSLASYLDKKAVLQLRDDRKLIGVLRSFDQFANVVMEGAYERIIVGDHYCDLQLGLYVVRGENVVLTGELDLEREELPQHMTRVSEAEITRAQKAEREVVQRSIRKRLEFLDFDKLRVASSYTCSHAQSHPQFCSFSPIVL
ncbi:sm-like protein LSM1B [Quercus lobata]|uniref:U6 snRNA-associated Sm-like protein LSm1 n=1 Tax=Quercus lobata TaxID=97700 RepID=A0A7N2LG26_QUELO|nr:sm-like protein LSM1B [Quercus lobata]